MYRLRLILLSRALLTICVGGVALPACAQSPYRLAESSDYRLATAFQPVATIPLLLVDKPHAGAIERAARRENLDPLLVHALIDVESRHNTQAVSPKGAIGLMQVLPETAERFGNGFKLTNADDNLRAGTRYLRLLIDRFDQRLDLALAAYNAGENAVERYDRHIPPYAETRQYVPAVLKRYADWKTPPPALHTAYLPGTLLTTGWEKRVAAP